MNGWTAAMRDAAAAWRRRVDDAIEHAHDPDPYGPIVCLFCGQRYRGLVGAAAHVDQEHAAAPRVDPQQPGIWCSENHDRPGATTARIHFHPAVRTPDTSHGRTDR